MNKSQVIGNLGKDPEIREVNGTQVANFTIATTERGFTKQDGTVIPDKTEWHNIVAWRGLAKLISYASKGSKVYVCGKLTTRSYDDAQGIKRYVTEIVADEMELLDKRVAGEGGSTPTANAAPQPKATNDPFAAASQNIPFDMGGNNDDDLPF